MKCNIKINYQDKICQNFLGVLEYWAHSHSVIHVGRDIRRFPVPPSPQRRARSGSRGGCLGLFPVPYWNPLKLDTYSTASCHYGERICIQLKPFLSLVLPPCTVVKDLFPTSWWAPGLRGDLYLVPSALLVRECSTSSFRTLIKMINRTDPTNIWTSSHHRY